ncbi:MAG TPA: hypothetical protein VF190_06860 [Rhodothermales bacterium]
MQREVLLAEMVDLLQSMLEDKGEEMQASAAAPLIGGEAIVTSIELVSYIGDVELMVSEKYQLDISLVSEQALSRRNSPFRTVETLADYVLELVGETVQEASAA